MVKPSTFVVGVVSRSSGQIQAPFSEDGERILLEPCAVLNPTPHASYASGGIGIVKFITYSRDIIEGNRDQYRHKFLLVRALSNEISHFGVNRQKSQFRFIPRALPPIISQPLQHV